MAICSSLPKSIAVLPFENQSGADDEYFADGVTDEILNTFAVVGTPEQIAPELGRRYGDVIQRISFYAPYKSDPERWARVLADLVRRRTGGMRRRPVDEERRGGDARR